MTSDQELERIRERKFAELVTRRDLLENGGKPILLTDDTFDSIKQYPLMLVDYWAVWCGPCQIIAPVVEDLAREYHGSVWVGKLNVDENPATAEKFQVQSIPTLILFKNGVEVDRIIGAVPKQTIDSRVRRHVTNA